MNYYAFVCLLIGYTFILRHWLMLILKLKNDDNWDDSSCVLHCSCICFSSSFCSSLVFVLHVIYLVFLLISPSNTCAFLFSQLNFSIFHSRSWLNIIISVLCSTAHLSVSFMLHLFTALPLLHMGHRCQPPLFHLSQTFEPYFFL